MHTVLWCVTERFELGIRLTGTATKRQRSNEPRQVYLRMSPHRVPLSIVEAFRSAGLGHASRYIDRMKYSKAMTIDKVARIGTREL